MNSTPQSTHVRVRSVYVTVCLPRRLQQWRVRQGPASAGREAEWSPGRSPGPARPRCRCRGPCRGRTGDISGAENTTVAQEGPCAVMTASEARPGVLWGCASELNVGAKAGSRAGQPVTMRAEARVGERGHGGSSLAPNRWRTENRIAIDGVSIRARRQSTTWEMRPGMLRLLHTADVHLSARHADMGEQATAQRERQF